MLTWKERLINARSEYARCLREFGLENATTLDGLESLLFRLESIWIKQYKETADLPTDIYGVDFQGYSFSIDATTGYTICAHGRSLVDLSFGDLLSQIDLLFATHDEPRRKELDFLIQRLEWLRRDYIDAFSIVQRRAYRQAERDVVVALGLSILLSAVPRRLGVAARAEVEKALFSATGGCISMGLDWFERWAQDAGPLQVECLCRTIIQMFDTPPLDFNKILPTTDGKRCVDLMRAHLLPHAARFEEKRPRSRKSAMNHRYPEGTVPFPIDVGHLVSHASGGPCDINLFPQRRDLNRGWSNGGKLYTGLI